MKKSYLFSLLGILTIGIAASAISMNHIQAKKERKLRKPKNPDVTLIGPVLMADGIGRQTAELACAIKDDFKVQIIANHLNTTDLPEPVHQILNTKYDRYGKIIIFEESLWHPQTKIERIFETTTQDDQIRIAYSMLESTRIPQEWVMQLNLYFDAVVVPDQFLIEAYRESGVTIPIFEIPLGIDLKKFMEKPLKQKAKYPMIFGNLSSCYNRKNHVLLIRAFARALGNNDNAVLRINCREGDEETIQEVKDEILKQGCSNIYFTQIRFKNDAYLKFFQSIDCYASLSKGEGFSIQPREAMALGIPVIVSDNTGQSTICKSGLVKAVKSEISEPAYYFKSEFNSGHRFNCELDDVVDAIKDVYLNYDQYVGKGADARKWVSNYCYSNDNLKVKYRGIVAPKKVILGSENKITDEYMITDSKELYDKYQKILNEKQKKKPHNKKSRKRGKIV